MKRWAFYAGVLVVFSCAVFGVGVLFGTTLVEC